MSEDLGGERERGFLRATHPRGLVVLAADLDHRRVVGVDGSIWSEVLRETYRLPADENQSQLISGNVVRTLIRAKR